MNVYLLGAGASKSYEISKTGNRLPLAKDFFKTFHELEISANGWVLIGDIINYVREKRNVDVLEFLKFNEDIEKLHSDIQKDYLEAIKKDSFEDITKYGKAYNQLVFLFCSVINEIQNGGESLFHKNLALGLNDDDAIITFNWDTLIDKSLVNNLSWSTQNGYSFQPKLIFKDGWKKGEPGESNVLLLKLHGSTNWLSSYIQFDFEDKKIGLNHSGPKDMVCVYESTKQPFPCYDGRYMDGYEAFSMGYYPPNLPSDLFTVKIPEGHTLIRNIVRSGINPKGNSGEEGVVSMPVIVPPVKNKSYDFYGDLFPTLWKRAEDALVKAETIYILGYSFPATDISSSNLFKQAFIRRISTPSIVIVNPYPDEILHKFKMEFGIPTKKIKVLKDFLCADYRLHNAV